MKSILVATDLSTRSDRAVQRALRLGARLKVPCHVVSVIDNDLPSDMLATSRSEVTARLTRFMQNLAAPAQEVTSSVLVGEPASAIVEQADFEEVSLLVLGLHRAQPFLDLISETTLVQIVRRSTRPVLLVNDPADHDYARVLVPVDFSASCAAALRVAGTISPGASLRSFHAVPIPFPGLTGDGPGSAMARELCGLAAKERDVWIAGLNMVPAPPEVEIISGGRAETTARLMATKPDLIAVGANTRPRYLPNVLGSFVTDLISDPPCDILVARA